MISLSFLARRPSGKRGLAVGLSVLALGLSGALAAAPAPAPANAPADPAAGPGAGPAAGLTRDAAKAQAEQDFDRLDVNHDGKIDAADRAALRDHRFERLDANHDGEISRQEFDHPAPGHDGPPPPPPPPGGDHPGFAPPGRPGHMGGAFMVLRKADPQHTGVVSKPAYVAAALALFDEADTNHDGVLSKPEREAAFARARAQMRKMWRAHHPDANQPGHEGGQWGGPDGQPGPGGDMPPPPEGM